MEHMLERMDVKLLVTLVGNQVVTVALVVAHKQILAVRRTGSVSVAGIYFCPILQRLFDRKESRMGVDFVGNIVRRQEVEHGFNSGIHLQKAKKVVQY